ncbi:hypothetical protein GCM10029963_33110 [Micromonospora andamanensis]|uniref:hypothetical protein n=1 Tax=Micromonospora andamanensis TaxID=1287068 RepID=UPI00195132C1|nr:hypothetical protein [Micromonospora andamanensis]GIJ42034.1 hypothetical protein Vwe01_53590 [Micromonospora andamanensis]
MSHCPARYRKCPACAAETGRYVLGRGLAIGLTAAVHAGRYRWEGTFHATDAVDRAAWDVLEVGGTEDHPHDTAHPKDARAAQ